MTLIITGSNYTFLKLEMFVPTHYFRASKIVILPNLFSEFPKDIRGVSSITCAKLVETWVQLEEGIPLDDMALSDKCKTIVTSIKRCLMTVA